MNQTHAPVFAEFELDHRLVFRANFNLLKKRLLVGFVITALVITTVIYFFMLIGEQKILLQTSPLFIGLPLVAFGGQLLADARLIKEVCLSAPFLPENDALLVSQ